MAESHRQHAGADDGDRAPLARVQTLAQEQVQPSSFETLLRSEITGSIGKLKGAEQASIAALTGNASTQQVVEALTAAELSLQKVTAVRDRVISAYQEVIRMPI